jgi:hypothetical protein
MGMSDIVVKIGGDTAAFNAALRSTKKDAKDLGKSLVGELMPTLMGLSGAGAFIALTKSAAELGDKVGHTSQALQLSTGEYQKFAEMAKSVGLQQESLNIAFKTFSRIIVDSVKDPTGDAALTLGKLGVTLDELKGKTPAQQFETLVKALNGVGDETERLALATKAFGDAGAGFIEMAGNWDSLASEAAEVATITNEAANASMRFSDAWRRLTESITVAVTESGLVGWLANVAEGISGLVNNANKLQKKGGSGAYSKTSYNVGAFALDAMAAPANFATNLITGESTTASEKIENLFSKTSKPRLTMGYTPEEQAKLDRSKALHDQGKSTQQDKIDETARRAKTKVDAANARKAAEQAKKDEALGEDLKALEGKVEAQRLVNDGLELEAKVREKIAELERKAGRQLTGEEKGRVGNALGSEQSLQDEKRVGDTIEDMRQKTEYQRLVNAGKKDEADLNQKIYDMEKAQGGRALTDEQKADVAGAMQDQKAVERDADLNTGAKKASESAMAEDRGGVNSLEKIGAIFGGRGDSGNETKKQTSLLEAVNKTLLQIRDKSGSEDSLDNSKETLD